MDKLYIVVPCYKEQEVLPETARRLQQKMEALQQAQLIHRDSRVVFVNDGSTDGTWSLITQLHEQNPLFEGINLSCNRGHQNALLAGLMTVKNYADVTISMDADLQDDIDAVDEMLQKYYDGCDIVYGVRSSRTTDTWFKRTTAEAFYHVMESLGAKVVFNHADYRLMSRRALEGLAQFKEVNLFLRGLVPLVGYPSDVVYYERHERFAGESKYPLRKMLSFAFEGITSLTTRPIRMIMMLGFLIFAVSLGMMLYFIAQFFLGDTVQGWASLAVSIWALGGIQLFAIGIIGEYIGKIYLETKGRPRFLVEQYLHTKPEENVAGKEEYHGQDNH